MEAGQVEQRFASKAPFPWFGGKSQAAPLVWQLLGDVSHYVEPFAGSLAVLLNRPHEANRAYASETVNDADGLIVNAWRSIQMHPVETARAASWPVTEADKVARQIAILRWRDEHELEHLMGDPLWCDPLIAGWWLWAVSVQIGAFSGGGPWTVDRSTGRVVKQGRAVRESGVTRNMPHVSDDGRGVTHQTVRESGVSRDMPHVSDDGRGVAHAAVREPGVSRDLPHVSDDGQGVGNAAVREPGVKRNMPHVSDDGQGATHQVVREPGVMRNRPHVTSNGRGVTHPAVRESGVKRDRPHVTSNGQGVTHQTVRESRVTSLWTGDVTLDDIQALDTIAAEFHDMTMPKLIGWMRLLSARLRHVRIINGDWTRVCTSGVINTLSVRGGKGVAGVFLDPPYDSSLRDKNLYAHDDGSVAAAVNAWCVENGTNPKWRIVVAGFGEEHDNLLDFGWTRHEWFVDGWLKGGMGQIANDGGHQQHLERLWASPACLPLVADTNTPTLFDM